MNEPALGLELCDALGCECSEAVVVAEEGDALACAVAEVVQQLPEGIDTAGGRNGGLVMTQS
jgi:hypothetical protein